MQTLKECGEGVKGVLAVGGGRLYPWQIQGCVWRLYRGSHYPVPKLILSERDRVPVQPWDSLHKSSRLMQCKKAEGEERSDCSLHALKQHLKFKSSSIHSLPPPPPTTHTVFHTAIAICPIWARSPKCLCLKCSAPALFTQEYKYISYTGFWNFCCKVNWQCIIYRTKI